MFVGALDHLVEITGDTAGGFATVHAINLGKRRAVGEPGQVRRTDGSMPQCTPASGCKFGSNADLDQSARLALMHHNYMDIIQRDGGQPACPLCAGAMPLVLKLKQASGRELLRFRCSLCDVIFMEQEPQLAARAYNFHTGLAV
jgi:hypothetical protein